jgi:starch-binding outer membrane protein, SusD/RagB family
MMKTMNTKHILLPVLAFTLAGMTSCDDWLDIKPENKIVLEDFWQTESQVESVLMSCYRGLTEKDVISRMIVWGELRSDNMIDGGSIKYDLYQILVGNIISSNGFCSWDKFYSVINYCNTLLYYAPKVLEADANFTQNDLNRITSEALAIRSLCYFYLVRSFNEVPWVEEASISDNQLFQVPKSSEREILAHIEQDLIKSKQYIVRDFGNKVKNKGFLTLNAVNALLADVYLWMGRYSDCVNACNEVLADTKLSLVEGESFFTQVFYQGNSTESIFELQFDQRVQQNESVIDYYGDANDPYGDLSFPVALAYDAEDNVKGENSPFNKKINSTVTESVDDIRCNEFIRPYSGMFFIFKYAGIRREENTPGKFTYRYRSTTPNWIRYRLPDVMLMKAEALVQLGGEANMKEALTLVNTTYLRSNLTADSLRMETYPTKSDLADLVLRERQRELLFEGKRWYDLVRLAKRENSVSALNSYVELKASGSNAILGAPVMDAMYMPISKTELSSNPFLTQNPYYEQKNSSSVR